jgi:hypothetical protein
VISAPALIIFRCGLWYRSRRLLTRSTTLTCKRTF